MYEIKSVITNSNSSYSFEMNRGEFVLQSRLNSVWDAVWTENWYRIETGIDWKETCWN